MNLSTESQDRTDAAGNDRIDVCHDLDLIDINEACRLVGGTKPVHRATIWRLVKAGKLPPPRRLHGGISRFVRREFLSNLRTMIEGSA